ncbi:helix-turn-helix transcriptional regulator [Patescibacteria group bacterium]|nr:helix-turn-helix transcriptional regulator [Patescibacteria group bacterium]
MEDFGKFKKRLLGDTEIRKSYEDLGPEFAIAQAVIEKRLEKGLTQLELAKKIGTKQSAISRLESGSYNPSLNFLDKVARALGMRLIINFS